MIPREHHNFVESFPFSVRGSGYFLRCGLPTGTACFVLRSRFYCGASIHLGITVAACPKFSCFRNSDAQGGACVVSSRSLISQTSPFSFLFLVVLTVMVWCRSGDSLHMRVRFTLIGQTTSFCRCFFILLFATKQQCDGLRKGNYAHCTIRRPSKPCWPDHLRLPRFVSLLCLLMAMVGSGVSDTRELPLASLRQTTSS